MLRGERSALTTKRLFSVLARHGIATSRTLEQKISDAGPIDQRIDPHVLTTVRNNLIADNRISRLIKPNAHWFYLPSTPRQIVQNRLNEQISILDLFQHRDLGLRVGQCLEIAIYKAFLLQDGLEFFGSFKNLDQHDDRTLFAKEEPPQSLSGNSLSGNERLDFLVRHPNAGWAGIEAKNVREWLYPDRQEILDLIRKAVTLDCVPILVARRFPFVTFKLLSTCGVVLHQTYNQLLPQSEHELAEKLKDKRLLGYHDIRLGNVPDSRLQKFLCHNLLRILPQARIRFEEYKDLLGNFSEQGISYKEFAARVRRRSQGTNEDHDWETQY